MTFEMRRVGSVTGVGRGAGRGEGRGLCLKDRASSALPRV